MTPAFENLQKALKQLPGLGHRSAERIALHLLVERPQRLPGLLHALQDAAAKVGRCQTCGNLAEGPRCAVCADPSRDTSRLCLVELVPDLAALERAGVYRGLYHVLHGRISPVNGVGPAHLNIASLDSRLAAGAISEVILALSNDIESEATCHYLKETIFGPRGLKISRIGFGLPSGGGLVFADSTTLRSAFDSRRAMV